MNPHGELIEKIKLINKYRPSIAKNLGLKEENVFPAMCKKHKINMKIGKYGWYCEKCKQVK